MFSFYGHDKIYIFSGVMGTRYSDWLLPRMPKDIFSLQSSEHIHKNPHILETQVSFIKYLSNLGMFIGKNLFFYIHGIIIVSPLAIWINFFIYFYWITSSDSPNSHCYHLYFVSAATIIFFIVHKGMAEIELNMTLNINIIYNPVIYTVVKYMTPSFTKV